jgi:UDP-glucose 4-epimerase
MRILVTGGAGFIGSHVAEAFLAAGHDVLVVDNLATGKRQNVPAGAEFVQADITQDDLDAVFGRFRPEVVDHFAAQASVKVSTSNALFDLEANGGGTARIAALCVKFGVGKLIYASTGGALYGDPEIWPVTEEHPIKPLSPYGLSKRVGELYIDLYRRTAGLHATILRYANAFGPRQDPHGEAGVIAIFTGRLLRGEECTIDGDGEQMKDYVYVGDIARANLLALTKGDGEAFNIGTGKGTSVNTIFRTLKAATGATRDARNGPPRPGDVRDIWLECAKARAGLGWEPNVSFEEGIRLTVEAARASG